MGGHTQRCSLGVGAGHRDGHPGRPSDNALGSDLRIIIAGQDVGDGRATEFDFLSTTIAGTFVTPPDSPAGDKGVAAAEVTVRADEELLGTAADEKNCDNGEFGDGTVDLKGCASSNATIVISKNPVAILEEADVGCSALAGTFVRVGPLVIVLPTGLITVTSPNSAPRQS